MTHFSYLNYFKRCFYSAKHKLPSSYTSAQIGLYVIKHEMSNFSNDDALNINRDTISFLDWVASL